MDATPCSSPTARSKLAEVRPVLAARQARGFPRVAQEAAGLGHRIQSFGLQLVEYCTGQPVLAEHGRHRRSAAG